MEPEEIKVGETYNVRMTLHRIDVDGDFCFRVFGGDDITRFLKPTQVERAVYPLSAPPNGIKNAEHAPKYDPCRLLKKGDRVQVKRRNGRCNGKHGEYLREAYCVVAEDEEQNELVRVFHNSSEYRLDPAYLELVTPVDELEPYTVDECGFAPTFYVRKNGKVYMTIPYKEGTSLFQSREEALAAAEAERDRLNKAYHEEYEQALSHE